MLFSRFLYQLFFLLPKLLYFLMRLCIVNAVHTPYLLCARSAISRSQIKKHRILHKLTNTKLTYGNRKGIEPIGSIADKLYTAVIVH